MYTITYLLFGGLNMLLPGSGSVRRYGLGVGAVFLEVVCHCGGGQTLLPASLLRMSVFSWVNYLGYGVFTPE